ncbi:MAG: hypothetical protein AB7O88_19825 [Reyranellaceae bacterium]
MATNALRFDAVFDEELGVVRQRRDAVGVDRAGQDTERLVRFVMDERFRDTSAFEPPRVDPATWPPDRWPLTRDDWTEGGGPRDRPAPDNLVGLALSGGGIRSAATCLGAIQALDAKGVMRQVDYLSSVSGGGYTAACLNANIAGARLPPGAPPARAAAGARPPSAPAGPRPFPAPSPGWIFPFPHVVGIRETVLFRYLRANAQYLIPRGKVLEYGFAPVLLVRGLFLNLWALLPLVLLLSTATLALLACPRLRNAGQAAEMLGATAAMLGVLWAAFFIVSRPVRNWLEGGRHIAAWAFLFALGVAVAGITAWWVDQAYGLIAGLVVAAVAALEWRRQIVFEAMRGRWRPDPTALHPAQHSVDPAAGLARESYRQAQAQALLVSVGALFVMLQPVVAAWVGLAMEDGRMSWQTGGALAAAVIGSTWLGKFEKLPDWARKALLLLAAALVGPVMLWGGSILITAAIALHGGVWTGGDLGTWVQITQGDTIVSWLAERSPAVRAAVYAGALAGVAALLWLANTFLYIANEVSPHSHYRDKLANTFLFSADLGNRNKVTSQSELKLSAMNVATAPFPLINAALNFVDRDEYRGRGRNATFFTFSPRHIGSTQVDFMRTEILEAVFPRFKLSSAMAISGAAAAANAGRITNPALRFLLALVNVRLGYWLPNPRLVMSDRFAPKTPGKWPAFPQAGAGHLLREMLGSLDTTTTFINVSDGGHIENLGIYELIRRRCRVIVAIDAEQDGAFSFVSLGDIVRFARIDRAVNIEIDVSAIKPDKDGISRRHAASGRIDYGRGEYGWLIYIKNSLTGREDESVLKYRAVQKDFPHHSTGDQFFDEEQFEAYRALGYHMVQETFARLR